MKQEEGCLSPGFIGTMNGSYDLFNFKPENVNPEEIFHTLGNMCRYGGRCNRFYSVAQHSMLVADILNAMEVSSDVALAGLCHDFSEAYLTDIIRPIKVMIPGIEEVEQSIMIAISEVMETGNHDESLVKFADNVALYHEAIHLGFDTGPWGFSEGVSSFCLEVSSIRIMTKAMTPAYASLELSRAYKYSATTREAK